ncbi:MAG: hypothetical protein IMW99_02985 [Firmicutes bacterium]|nr:hypothetical protein [Bacillota bacterium]
MKGQALTVFSGRKPEPFPVEILGVLKNAGPGTDLILVRVGGEAVQAGGGISAGMSGSPIYVDGKLVGAIAYSVGGSDHRLGLATPIESMLPLLSEADGTEGAGSEKAAPTPPESVAAEGGILPVQPIATPVLTSGLDARRSGALLAQWLKPWGLVVSGPGLGSGGAGENAGGSGSFPDPLSAGQSGAASGNGLQTGSGVAALQPGSAFGVRLVGGDVDVSALGTVTLVEGQRFLGFGHPFLTKGAVDLAATDVTVYTTVPSQDLPFKIGATGAVIGTIVQDRPTAVAGRLGQAPSMVSIALTVVDQDRQRRSQFRAEVANDPDLVVGLLGVAALEGLDRGLARVGKGTMSLQFSIKAKGLPVEELTRQNLFYDPVDISAASLSELVSGLGLIMYNPFVPVQLESVQVVATASQKRQTARIEKVSLAPGSPASFHPGDKVSLVATLRPYRGQVFTQPIQVSLPGDMAPGPLTITVRAGGVQPAQQDNGQGTSSLTLPGNVSLPPGAEEPQTPAGPQSLEQLLKEFAEGERSNDLVAEFYPGPSQTQHEAPGAAGSDAGAAEMDGAGQDAGGGGAGPALNSPGADAGSGPGGGGNGPSAPLPPEHPKAGTAPRNTAPSVAPAEEAPVRSAVSTEYVLEGSTEITINVEEAGGRESAAAGPEAGKNPPQPGDGEAPTAQK